MTHSKLKESLQQLQSEVDRLQSVSATEKKELEAVIRNIQKTLDQEHPFGSELQDSLGSAIARLEASHPRLTAVLNDIMVTLGNMGI